MLKNQQMSHGAFSLIGFMLRQFELDRSVQLQLENWRAHIVA
jgi:hypothetical protein